jgi:hypothetical protein
MNVQHLKKKGFPDFFDLQNLSFYTHLVLGCMLLVHARNSYKKVKDVYVGNYMSIPMICKVLSIPYFSSILKVRNKKSL